MSTQTIDRFIRDMRIAGRSPKTVSSYLYGIKRLIKHTGKDPEDVSLEEIRDFQHHMCHVEKTSWATYNITTCAMRFFFRHTCQKDWVIGKINFGRREKLLPVVLSRDEVTRMFRGSRFFMFKVIMLTAYSTGMRITEVRNLKLSDIDRDRNVILVRCGKGARQREVPLSPILLKYLEELWKRNKKRMDKYFFFMSRNPASPIHESWIHKNIKETRLKVKIDKKVTMHAFRHSFATHLLEDGVNFIQLKKLLGHASIKTTLNYVHVIQESFAMIKSPLDSLLEKEDDNEL